MPLKQPDPSQQAPVFHLKPKKGPAADAARARAKAKAAEKKHDDPIFAARQSHDLRSQAGARAAANAGLTPHTSTPFGGGGGTQDKLQANLTAKVALAKLRQARAQQGGILSPEQLAHEKAATTALATSRALNFLDKHNLAATRYGDLTKLQPGKEVKPAQIGAPFAPPEHAAPEHTNARGNIYSGHVAAMPKISDTLGGLATDILNHITPVIGGPTFGQAARFGEHAGAVSAKIAAPAGKPPHVDISGFVKRTVDPEAGAAGTKNAPVYADSPDLGHYSLTDEGRKQFAKMIEANGYNMKDAKTWNDQDYVTRAFVKNDTGAGATLRNLAADFGQQASLTAAPSMYGNAVLDSIRNKSVAPILRLEGQTAQGFINTAPFVGDRPWLENLQERPLTTIETVLPFIKGGSSVLGRGLGHAGIGAFKGTRDVTMPSAAEAVRRGLAKPGSEKVTVPASHEIITRSVQALHDAVLNRAAHPSETARRPGVAGSPPGVFAGLRHDFTPTRTVGRAGHALEKRLDSKAYEHQKALARLQAGRQPHLVLGEYMKQIRQLPWVRNRKKPGAKIGAVEATVMHGSFATDSGQVSEAFLTWAKESHDNATWARAKAEEARAAGDTASAKHFAARAEKFDAQAKDQEAWAEQSTRNNYKPGDNGPLEEAARKASREQTRMRVDAGKMDEPGALYGDLQLRMAIVHATEGPGTVRGGAEGTPAWHAADKLINDATGSRHAFLDARASLHGRTAEEEAKNPVDASLDPRSPEARYQLGRHQSAAYLEQIAIRRNYDREARQREALANKHPGAQSSVDIARAAATHAGVGIDVVQKVLNSALTGLHEMRGAVDRRQAELEQLAGQVEGVERRAHEARGSEALRGLQTQLEIAQRAGSSPLKIRKINEAITAEQAKLDAFTPSKNLLELRGAAEKQRMMSMVRELSGKQINKIIMENTTPEERRAIGHQRLVDAVTEQMDSLVHKDLPDKLAAIKNDAAQAYNAATGKDVLKAQVYGKAHARYTEDLRAFKETQLAEGRDPFHTRLHYPDEPSSLPQNLQATGEQFQSGKFTPDMHFYMAKDLEGLSRQAVETKLMQGLSESPLVLDTPPAGSEVPPGWVYVNAENWKNLKKTSRDANQVQNLLDGWRKGEAIPRIPDGDQGGALISKNLQEMLARDLKAHDHSDVSALLRATNAYRRWMLYTLPRTLVNNAVGNPILASIQGAGVKTYVDSIRLLRNHPERIMHTLRRRGPIANIMETDAAKMTGWQAFWRNANTFHEDNGNLMVYLLHAKRAFKKENGLHWFNQVSAMDDHFGAFLEKASKGENPDAFKWAAKSAQMFGDMFRTFKHDNTLAQLFLFHRWVGHMLAVQAMMPFRYPGRTAFLQQTAILADQYRKEHGVFPDWARSYIPLWSTIETAGGLPQSVTWALSGGGINPFSTPAQTFDLGGVGQDKNPAQSLLASNVTPLLRVPGEWAFGTRADTLQPFKDEAGNVIHPFTGAGLGQLANSVIANTPIVNTLFPRTGLSDNSIQVPILNAVGIGSSHPAFKAAAAHDPSMLSARTYGHGFWKDAALIAGNALGVPVRALDAKGNRTDTSAGRTATYQANEMTKRKNKQGAKFWKESLDLWAKDPAAWKRSKYNPDSPSYQDPAA